MLYKKIKLTIILIILFFVSILFFSCGPLPLSRLGSVKNISVSVINRSVSRNLSPDSRSLGKYVINEITDDTYFKTDRKDTNRGIFINSFTPDEFILDLDLISLYSGNREAELTPTRTTPEGYIIPRHINIVNANDFIRDFLIMTPKWDGLYMQFLPGIGATGTESFNMNFMSIIGVDLGSDYDGIYLQNEKTMELELLLPGVLESGLHYFDFSSLQPYNVDFLSYLIIGSDVETSGIQNPDSTIFDWELPGGGTTDGNASMIFIPGSDIDFTPYTNPKVIFNWDLTNLIQVYEGPTSAKEDDVVTFNLTNPFPVSITVEEDSDQSSQSGSGDTIPPDEVALYAIYGTQSYNVLIWINPADTDFDKIVIVRKTDSEPANKEDGEIVYEGYEPNFCDTTGTPGTHYYYKLFTVDYSGNYSTGVPLDKILE